MTLRLPAASGHENVTDTPSVKFDVEVGFLSRNQVVKFQVSPGWMGTSSGAGRLVMSTVMPKVPDGPELCTWFTKRPTVPSRQRFPCEPPGFATKPWVSDTRK